MKKLFVTLAISAVGFAFILATPAEAAKKKSKHTRSVATAQTMQYPQTAEAVPRAGVGYQGGVMRGPLYNGQDYIGDDPDPSIRAFLIKNLSGRYGSSY